VIFGPRFSSLRPWLLTIPPHRLTCLQPDPRSNLAISPGVITGPAHGLKVGRLMVRSPRVEPFWSTFGWHGADDDEGCMAASWPYATWRVATRPPAWSNTRSGLGQSGPPIDVVFGIRTMCLYRLLEFVRRFGNSSYYCSGKFPPPHFPFTARPPCIRVRVFNLFHDR